MIKKVFTDGLLQIAIVLSLLRTDWNNYLNSLHDYQSYPEIQDIILGPLSGITQTDFHSQGWHPSSLGGYAHPKNLDNYNTHSVLRDLHQLSHYRRFDGVSTNIDAWLVNEPGMVQLPSEEAETNEQSQTDENDNNLDAQADVQLTVQPEGSQTSHNQGPVETSTANFALPSELTKEV